MRKLKWLAVLLILFVAGVALVPGAAAQSDERLQVTVVAEALNVRTGPGLTYPAFRVLMQGEQLPVIGYDAALDWWQVLLPYGDTGWISGGDEYVSVSPDTSGQPLNIVTDYPVPANYQLPTANYQLAETIVFQTISGGPIYAINADGTHLRYLTMGLDPVLSPDGQWVVFSRWNTNQNGALGNLWLINVDGSGQRVIMDNVLQPRTPVWSPDGSQIIIGMQHGGRVQDERVCGDQRPPRGAFDISVRREGRKIVKFCYTLPADPHWGLRLVNVATGKFEDLRHDTYTFSPAWDPANPWRLVYDGDRGLVNLDLNQNTTWPLTGDFNDRSPIFSPDGSKIAVSYRQDDHWEVHVMNADGSGAVRLTQTSYQTLVEQHLNGEISHSYNNAAPTWSPDGSQIAFLTDRTGQWEIWVMNADGSNQRPLFSAETLAGINLQYNGVDERVLSWR